ncbi:AzlC family ABC transporter permease [Paenalkalicoccus suaedae]|nr:AzlC family ABC transporter permease [Paenalkalicoccus suaedae]
MTYKKSWSEESRAGAVQGVPIAFGYMPVALTFGLIAATTGLTFIEAVMMSIVVFAGAAQYMALTMIALQSSAAEIVFSTFVVNLRHVLMSASIKERADHSSKTMRALYGFFLTDEVFAVASVKEAPIKAPYILGVGVVAYSSWVVFTGVGFYAGAILPDVMQESMGIALYALFIALLIPSVKSQGASVMVLAVLGGGFHLILQQWLSTGWAIMGATILAVCVYEGIDQMRRVSNDK